MKTRTSLYKYLLLTLFSISIITDLKAQKDTAANKLSLDIGWTRGKDINLWPILKRSKTKEETDLQVFFTIYRKHMYLGKHQKHTHLFPVYWKDSSASNKDLRLFSLYYPSILRFTSNDSIGLHSFKFIELAPKISLLEVSRSKDGLQVQNNFFFFIFYSNNVALRKSSFVTFPLYWSFRNQGNYSHTLFPIFSTGTYGDSTHKYTAITPLFWHFNAKGWHKNVLFPIWWNTQCGHGDSAISSNVIFPVYWHYKNKLEKKTLIFPISYHYKGQYYRSYTFFPIFSAGHSTDSLKARSYFAITPLLWHFKNEDKKRSVFFPIYWHYTDEGSSKTVLFPLLWSYRDSNYRSVTFFPLFSAGHSLKNENSNYFAISPLFWHVRDGDETRNILFPIWWDYKKKDFHRSILFPLIWIRNYKDNKSFTFFPLFRIGSTPYRKFYSITPFFRHTSSYQGSEVKNTLFPIWWYSRHTYAKDTVLVNTIFPIYWSKSSKYENYKVLFPLIWWFKYQQEQSLTIMPFFSYAQNRDTLYPFTRLAITPFFWHVQKANYERDFLFPIWWYMKKGLGKGQEYYQVIFPIYWQYDNRYYKSFSIMPFFSIKKSKDSLHPSTRLAITPFFWHYEWSYKSEEVHRNVLFPLWWYKKEHHYGQLRDHNILFPVYWSHIGRHGKYDILFPLVWSYRMTRYNSLTVLPLFSYGHSMDSLRERRHLAITPLFWHIRKGNQYQTVFFPLVWHKKIDAGENTSVSNIVFPIYWSQKRRDDKYSVLFPFYWSFEDKHYKSITIFPLVSFGRTKDSTNKSSHLAIAPFYWHSIHDDHTKTILFPLWWHNRNGVGDNKTVSNYIFPLYWSHVEKDESKRVFFPIVWSYKDYYYRSFTFAPLFSYGRTRDSLHAKGYVMLTPLFWHFKDNGVNRTVFLPFFNSYIADKDHEKRFNAFFVLFRYKQKEQKTRYSFLWPICEFVKDTNNKYFRFAPIVWYQHSAKSNYFSIQPFFYHSKDTASERLFILWQLYTYRNTFNVGQSNHILWRLISWTHYKNGDHEFRLIYRFFSNVAKDSGMEKSFFPFYFISRQKNGDKVFSTAFGLYHKSKHKIENTKEYYQEIKVLWFIRLLSNYKALKAKGITNIRQ